MLSVQSDLWVNKADQKKAGSRSHLFKYSNSMMFLHVMQSISVYENLPKLFSVLSADVFMGNQEMPTSFHCMFSCMQCVWLE